MWLKFAHFKGGKWEVILMQQKEKTTTKYKYQKFILSLFCRSFLLLTCNSTRSKSDE